MSRIGKQPIKLPQGVTAKLVDGNVEVKGPKGAVSFNVYGRVSLAEENGTLSVVLSEGQETKYWGLYRTLTANAVKGVAEGYQKELELIGTGYRANVTGKTLNLTVGLSHPVNFDPPAGISFEINKAGKVVVAGVNKELVGEMAAKVRAVRPPEPYHGKGIRYVGEVIITKVGKSSGKGKKK